MTEARFTPGPWKVGSRHTASGVYDQRDNLVANTHSGQRNFNRDEQIAEQDANAHLIAAAPEIYASHDALLRIIEDAMPELCGCAEIQTAYRVRDKARGAA